MALLLPEADGIADYVGRRLPHAEVLRYGGADGGRLDEVTFYCLPYMGDAASIALISRLPRLTVVQSLSSGVDEVLGSLPPRATLCNGQGLGHEEGTAELAVTLILASIRQIPRFAGQQAVRTWSHVRTGSLDGQRVLLVGYGAIGAAIEQRLVPFGARVSRVSRTARDGVSGLGELPVLAQAADILVVCIALHPSTRGLIGHEVLSALPDGALVVNVARGPVVDAAALTGQLQAGAARRAGRHGPGAAASRPPRVGAAPRADHAPHRRRHRHVRAPRPGLRRGTGRLPSGRPSAPERRPASVRVIGQSAEEPHGAVSVRHRGADVSMASGSTGAP